MSSVVVCDAYYMPVREIGVEDAVALLVSGKADPIRTEDGLPTVGSLGLAPSATANWAARFPGLIEDGLFRVPAAIRLRRAIAYRLGGLRPSRRGILLRDRHTCQYCGDQANLTLDHVLPASRGGPNTWENLVAACAPCNQYKADRTPEEAGMRLAHPPRRFRPNLYMEAMAKLNARLA